MYTAEPSSLSRPQMQAAQIRGFSMTGNILKDVFHSNSRSEKLSIKVVLLGT